MAEPLADPSDRGPTRREFLGQATVAGAGAIMAPTLSSLGAQATAAANDSASTIPLHLTVNGQEHRLQVDARTTLLDLLRENLALTGSKKGCDHGQCGSCTVMVNGRRINSCLALAIAHDGDEITTIEGLAHGDQLHPVQEAFIKCDGFQCGYCTPGQIMSAVALLKEGCPKTDEGIREMMSGNICRCGAYNGILQAIRDAQKATPSS